MAAVAAVAATAAIASATAEVTAANVAAETAAALSDRRRTSGARIGCNHFRWPTDIADRQRRLCESVVYLLESAKSNVHV